MLMGFDRMAFNTDFIIYSVKTCHKKTQNNYVFKTENWLMQVKKYCWTPLSYLFEWLEIISHYKKDWLLHCTLMYCNRLHAWWSTQSPLATLLSSLIARRWVGLQTLRRFRLKDLSFEDMVWLLSDPQGFICWISIAQVSVVFTVESLSLLYLLFIFISLYLFVLGDDALIS